MANGFLRGLDRFMTAVSGNWRKGKAEAWWENHGRPPPDTPEGKRYDAADAAFRAQVQNPPPVHGDERWMSAAQAQAFSAEQYKAFEHPESADLVLLGAYLDPLKGEPVCAAYSKGPGHVLTVAGTRAGKGVCHIIPNLLIVPRPMLVIDPKGENFGITAQHRRSFGPVYRLDPFRVTSAYDTDSPFARFNPIAFVKADTDARRLASMLLGDAPDSAHGNARFFYNEALNFLAALVWLAARSSTPTLGMVSDMIGQSREAFFDGLQGMSGSADPVIARAANRLLNTPEETRGGILAQINSATAIWSERALKEATSACDFDLADMKHETMTVYVVLPFDKLSDYRALLRMMIGQFYSAMIRDSRPAASPVMCFVDEFPALGRMDDIVSALGEISGMNVRFWLFAQSMARLRSLYGDDLHSILANCSTQCFFGVNDGETARWLSQELGNRTQAEEVIGFNAGINPNRDKDTWLAPSQNSNTGFHRGIHYFGQPLMSPQKVRELLGVGTGCAVVMQSGLPPALCSLARWFDNPDLVKEGRDIRTMQSARPPKADVPWGIHPID